MVDTYLLFVTIYHFLKENILSKVILIETNLSWGGKVWIYLTKYIQDNLCLTWRVFFLHHKHTHHSDFLGNILKLNLVLGRKGLQDKAFQWRYEIANNRLISWIAFASLVGWGFLFLTKIGFLFNASQSKGYFSTKERGANIIILIQ